MWFPFTHFFFFFLFMSSLASCPFISLLSFFCAHNGPGLSLYAHIHFSTQVQVAQVSTMRWGSSVVPVHLVSPSPQPHTLLPRLVLLLMSSPFCLCCAHICTFVLAKMFCLPSGRRVCVCVLCVSTPGQRAPFTISVKQGAQAHRGYLCQPKLFHDGGCGD